MLAGAFSCYHLNAHRSDEYIVPEASDGDVADTACPGKILLEEHQVSSPLFLIKTETDTQATFTSHHARFPQAHCAAAIDSGHACEVGYGYLEVDDAESYCEGGESDSHDHDGITPPLTPPVVRCYCFSSNECYPLCSNAERTGRGNAERTGRGNAQTGPARTRIYHRSADYGLARLARSALGSADPVGASCGRAHISRAAGRLWRNESNCAQSEAEGTQRQRPDQPQQ